VGVSVGVGVGVEVGVEFMVALEVTCIVAIASVAEGDCDGPVAPSLFR